MGEPTDWRAGVLARLGGAAVVGALTGGVALSAGHLIPIARVPVGCRPRGSVACGIAEPLFGVVVGAFLWLVAVVVAALLAGVLFGGLAARLAGVRIGVATPVAWPLTLWAIAILLRPFGVDMRLNGAGLIGYVAVAFVLVAALTVPQWWRSVFSR
jgi:hypothetical protein